MGKTGFYSNEWTFWHSVGQQALFLPVGGHVQATALAGADTPDSKRRLLNLLHTSGLAAYLAMRDAPPVSRADLLRVHTARYVDEFEAVSRAGGGDIGDFAPFSAGGYEIARVSAGLAKAAVGAVVVGDLRNAYALCRPAGHHCLPDRSMGFCLLANIAIAVEAARADHKLGKVAIVDWDVHHGNGTQAVYYDRADTLTISLHQENCYPPGYSGIDDRGSGAGCGFNVNIALPPGTGDAGYRKAIEDIVVPQLERFAPDLIVVASGLDAGAADPMARMLAHGKTFSAMTGRMMDCADRLCGGRLAMIHEGGYSEATVPFMGLAVLEALSGETTGVSDPTLPIFEAQQPGADTIAYQARRIDEMAAVFNDG